MRTLTGPVAWMCALALAGCVSATAPPTIAGPAATTVAATPTTVPAMTATPSSAAPGPSASGLAGTWNGTYQSGKYPNTHGTFEVTFAQTGHAIAGRVHIDSDCVGDGTVTGNVTNDRISFGVVKAAQTISFDGTITSGGLRGTYHSGAGCGDDNGTWTAQRT